MDDEPQNGTSIRIEGGEGFYWDHVISADEIQAVRTYLREKYGEEPVVSTSP